VPQQTFLFVASDVHASIRLISTIKNATYGDPEGNLDMVARGTARIHDRAVVGKCVFVCNYDAVDESCG
jgi:hypothetical protein